LCNAPGKGTDGEFDEFLALEHEAACAICSAERRRHVLPNPLPSDGRARGAAILSAI
jgi:hypothetical protein